MKKCFLLLILLSITACNDKTDEKIVTENNNPPVVVENKEISQPSKTENVQASIPVKEEWKSGYSHARPIKVSDFFEYDITQFLPRTYVGQSAIWRDLMKYSKETHIFNEMCSQNNSFIQTAKAINYQADQNYNKAFEWYMLAANKGNIFAESRLGEMYLMGLGVEKDYEKARYWFEKSALKGYFFAETALALLYLDIEFNRKNTFFHPRGGVFFHGNRLVNTKLGKGADKGMAQYWLSKSAYRNDPYSRGIASALGIRLLEGRMLKKRAQDYQLETVQDYQLEAMIDAPKISCFYNRNDTMPEKIFIKPKNMVELHYLEKPQYIK